MEAGLEVVGQWIQSEVLSPTALTLAPTLGSMTKILGSLGEEVVSFRESSTVV